MTRLRLIACGCGVVIAAAGCGLQRITVPIMPPFIPAPKPAIAWAESFDALTLEEWRDVEVKGHTAYEAVELSGRRCLRATSQATASILLHAVRIQVEDHPWLSWDWRVDQLVEGEALHEKRGSDAAARVYVYFESKGPPWSKRNIDYVWSATLPVGTILESAFAPTSKIIVVESGAASLGTWRHVTRNVAADYVRCFGGKPPRAIAVGLMTDTDNTNTSALAYFDDVQFTRTAPDATVARP